MRLATCVFLATFVLGARPAAAEEMIVALRVNSQSRGDVLVDVQADGSALMAAAEAGKLGFTKERLSQLARPDGIVVLMSRSDLKVQLNPESLTLEVSAEPVWFARTSLSLSSRGAIKVSQLQGVHGWLNYAVSAQAARGADPTAGVETSAVVSYKGWTLQSDQNMAIAEQGTTFKRLRSAVAYDDLTSMTRLSAGDVTPQVGLGSTASRLLGVQWSRRFEFAPEVVRQPTFGWSGQVVTPSTVDVFVDGVRVRTFSVAPGPFDLRELSYFDGLRNVEVVIRDRAGGESRLTIPYYFANDLLAAGRDSFDVAIGTERAADGSKPWAISGSYRRGLSDAVTLGSALEAKSDYQSARFEFGLRSEKLGTLFATAAASKARDALAAGHLSVAHQWSGGRLSTQMAATRQSAGFGIDPQVQGTARQMSQRRGASAGYSMDRQRSVSMNFLRTKYARAASESILSVRVAQSWGRSGSVWSSVSQIAQDGQRTNVFAIGVSLPLGPRWSVSTTHTYEVRGENSTNVRAARSDADDGWTNLRLAAEHRSNSTTVDAFIQRPFSFGTLSLSSRAADGQAKFEFGGESRFAGAVSFADQKLWLSPPIAQSFALVDAAGAPNVRVMHNNQLAGRTDDSGRLLLPNLAAFTANQIRIDDRDIPMEIELESVQQEIAPRFNAGTNVVFRGKRFAAVAGTLESSDATGKTIKVTAAELTVTQGAETVVSSTDEQGGFYLDNIKPGRWSITAINRNVRCAAELTLPDPIPTFIDLGVVTCAGN